MQETARMVVYLDDNEQRRAAVADEFARLPARADTGLCAVAQLAELPSRSTPSVVALDVESLGVAATRAWIETLRMAAPRQPDAACRIVAIFPSHLARTEANDWPVALRMVRRSEDAQWAEYAWDVANALSQQLDLALVLAAAATRQANRDALDAATARAATGGHAELRDAVTGLYTHNAFFERLREEIARATRYGQPMSLVVVDIDQFSTLNYELGYASGDDILRRIAGAMAESEQGEAVRRSDIAARYSGGEFVLLLPETHKNGALARAARLRDAVAATAMPNGRAVSLSMGVACFPDDANDGDSLMAAAEAALRGAKRGGAGRIQFFAGGHEGPNATRTFERMRETSVDKFRPYHDRLGEVATMLHRDRALACLLIDLTRLRRVELDLGVAHHSEIYDRAAKALDSLRGTLLADADLLCRTGDGDGYVVFLAGAPTVPGRGNLEELAARVEDAVESALAPAARELLRGEARITVGAARVLGNSMLRPERLINRLISEARHAARLSRERTDLRDKSRLQDIILGEGLSSVYQPIVDLHTSDIFAFEALTRGPKGTSMESPATLFSVADEVDLTFELDRACFRGALRSAVGLPPVHRLFVNLLPMSFYDASFIEFEVNHLLSAAGLTPANIVFEITEKLAIENFGSFRRALAGYTAMGFGVAIDDVGTRHSNLETVMALRPHFIKISDVLVRGIARSPVKREMMRSLRRIAEAVDAAVVAEGIETPEDLAVLRDLGLRYGQGYFMARPGPPFPDLIAGVRETIEAIGASAAMRVRDDSQILIDFGEDADDGDDGFDEMRVFSVRGSVNEMIVGAGFRDEEITNGFARESERTRPNSWSPLVTSREEPRTLPPPPPPGAAATTASVSTEAQGAEEPQS